MKLAWALALVLTAAPAFAAERLRVAVIRVIGPDDEARMRAEARLIEGLRQGGADVAASESLSYMLGFFGGDKLVRCVVLQDGACDTAPVLDGVDVLVVGELEHYDQRLRLHLATADGQRLQKLEIEEDTAAGLLAVLRGKGARLAKELRGAPVPPEPAIVRAGDIVIPPEPEDPFPPLVAPPVADARTQRLATAPPPQRAAPLPSAPAPAPSPREAPARVAAAPLPPAPPPVAAPEPARPPEPAKADEPVEPAAPAKAAVPKAPPKAATVVAAAPARPQPARVAPATPPPPKPAVKPAPVKPRVSVDVPDAAAEKAPAMPDSKYRVVRPRIPGGPWPILATGIGLTGLSGIFAMNAATSARILESPGDSGPRGAAHAAELRDAQARDTTLAVVLGLAGTVGITTGIVLLNLQPGPVRMTVVPAGTGLRLSGTF